MIMKLLIKYFPVVVCIMAVFISFIAVGHWFFGDRILYFWDAYLPFDPKISFDQLYYFWQDRIFPGFGTPGWSWFLFWGIFFLPSLINPSLSIGECLIYTFLLSFSIINFYLLVVNILKTIFRDNSKNLLINSVGLTVAFLYTFNVFTFFNFYFMFNPGAFILAFLPINILALINIYPLDKEICSNKRNLWLFIFFASLIAMSPGFGVYVFFLQYIVWISLYLFLFWFVSKCKVLSRLTRELVLFYILILFINLWWFFPALLNLVSSYSGQSNFGTTVWFDQGFKDVQLLNAFRLLGSGLMANNKFSWSHWYNNNLFTLPLFIFPGFFIASLIFLRKKLSILLTFLLIVTVFSLFIVKFSNPPFAWILSFAFHHIPFFGGFRDSVQKAGVYFQLGYMIFVAIGITFIARVIIEKSLKLLSYLFLTIFIIASVVLSGPFFLFIKDNVRIERFSFDNKNYLISAKTKIPPEYQSLKTFIEDKCKGETIASVPRSGFVTDGIWEKYNLSYVGQDILPAFIDCNFLTTATFNTNAEYSIQAPYIFLQRDDIGAFKNYLTQTKIRFVLIRKDHVPYGYVAWLYVDPKNIENLLSLDNEFTKVYTNDYFTLFERNDDNKNQYGFQLTKDVLNVQYSFKSGVDYAVVSKRIGDIKQPVMLSSLTDYNLYEKDITMYTAIGNCIGCIKIEDAKYTSETPTFFSVLLDFIKKSVKSIINPKGLGSIKEDVRISLKIIDTHRRFDGLIRSARDKSNNNIKSGIDDYIFSWREIELLLSQYDADRFAINNKYIEARNFLRVEGNTILSYMSSQLTADSLKFFSLFTFQRALLDRFTESVFETDFANNKYLLRLDIPQDEYYVCEAMASENNAAIANISIDNTTLTKEEYGGESPIFLKKGTYLVTVNYQPLEMLNNPQVMLKTGNVRKIKIGRLNPGSYKLDFQVGPKSQDRMLIAVSQGSIQEDKIKYISSLEKPGENFLFTDLTTETTTIHQGYSKTFNVQLPTSQEYFLYIFNIDAVSDKIDISNLTVKTAISTEGAIQFSCGSKSLTGETAEIISANKLSPTHYELTVPEDYKGFLTFNQTYDDSWVAHKENDKSEFPHFRSGYANAWYIDESEGKITIEYKKQGLTEKAGIISIIVTLLSLILYLRLRKF